MRSVLKFGGFLVVGCHLFICLFQRVRDQWTQSCPMHCSFLRPNMSLEHFDKYYQLACHTDWSRFFCIP